MREFFVEARSLKGIPEAVLVTVRGSIDFTTAIRFREEIEASRKGGARRFIMDMDGVTYINSGGLSVLIGLTGTGTPETPSLALLKVPPKIKALIDLLNLGFRYSHTLEEAIDTIGRPSSSSHPAVSVPNDHPTD